MSFEYHPGEAEFEEYLERISKEAIEEFAWERLTSFYQENPRVAERASWCLAEARLIAAHSPSGAVVFSAIAIELAVRNVLVAPLVYGLVHSGTLAGVVSETILSLRELSRFKDFLLKVLAEHADTPFRLG